MSDSGQTGRFEMGRTRTMVVATVLMGPTWAARAETPGQAAGRPDGEVIGAFALFAIVGLILMIVLLVAMYVIMRTGRRRRALAAEQREPTEYQDVWAMHKPPDIDVLDDEDDDFWGADRTAKP